MRKNTTNISLATKQQIYNDFLNLEKRDKLKSEKQISKKIREEKAAQKLFQKEFIEKFKRDERNSLRQIKKEKLEKRKINLNLNRKLNIGKIFEKELYDENHIKFYSKQQEIFLVRPIVINLQLIESGEFLTFLIHNFSDAVFKFVNKFKNHKEKHLFTIGYHFFFEGLAGNKTLAHGFRPKTELPFSQLDLEIALEKLYLEIKERFAIYYARAGSHVLKFRGLTLETSPM